MIHTLYKKKKKKYYIIYIRVCTKNGTAGSEDRVAKLFECVWRVCVTPVTYVTRVTNTGYDEPVTLLRKDTTMFVRIRKFFDDVASLIEARTIIDRMDGLDDTDLQSYVESLYYDLLIQDVVEGSRKNWSRINRVARAIWSLKDRETALRFTTALEPTRNKMNKLAAVLDA